MLHAAQPDHDHDHGHGLGHDHGPGHHDGPAHGHDHGPGQGHDHGLGHDHGDRHDHVHVHGAEDHSHVGEGFVAVDVGPGYGAVILWMPESLMGAEIEVRRVGDTDPPTHVMVLGRPVDGVRVPTCVYPSLPVGDYEFWVKPDGPVALTVSVPESVVTEATWPAPILPAGRS